MKNKPRKLERLDKNDSYVPTRSKGFVWRDEVDADFFPALSSILIDEELALDNILDEERLFLFSQFLAPIKIDEYIEMVAALRSNVHFFQHNSIHILNMTWECISGGGDSYGHSEIVCSRNTMPVKFGRIFSCWTGLGDLKIFHLNSLEYMNYESIFNWKSKISEVDISPEIYESFALAISMHCQARNMSSELYLKRFIEINISGKLPDELDLD